MRGLTFADGFGHVKRAFALVFSLVLLCGCSGQSEATATPGSQIPGFYSTGQEIQGGEDIQELNLRSVTAAVSGGETILTLSFVTGSTLAGGAEKPLNATPRYAIEALEGPGRLMVTLPLHYSDYSGNVPEPMGLFTAMYALPGKADEEGTRLYFQFTGKIGFKADEQNGMLILHIEPENPDEEEAYYTSLAYEDATRDVAASNGMHPVLCDDGENMLYLSSPFSDNTQADELMALLNGRLEASQSNQRAGVITLAGNAAPAYQANISRDQLKSLGALLTPEGKQVLAEPWAVDARFLAWMPDGKGLCAHPVVRAEDGNQVALEQLWVYDVSGNRERFIESDFSYVDRAALSPDGRYLAFIERAETKRLLYLYDSATGLLDLASGEGMGDFTVSFAWSDDNKLYALSGTESIQLMRLDPALTGKDDSRVTAVEERYGGAGSVFYAGGKVYISGDVAGKIFSVDPATGEREEFAAGDGFTVSPDGKIMLISYYEEGGIDSQTGVKVRDIATGDEVELTSGLSYHGSCWSRDSSLLSYLVSNYEQLDVTEDLELEEVQESGGVGVDGTNADDYPARLYTYSPLEGVCVLRGVLASDLIYPGLTGREVVLVAYHERADHTLMPVTYRLTLP